MSLRTGVDGEKAAAGLMRRGIAKKGYGCFFGYHTPGNAYSKR